MSDSQLLKIKHALESGRRINPMDALSEFGCFRLAARIQDLRDAGMNIGTNMKSNGNGKRFAEYYVEA